MALPRSRRHLAHLLAVLVERQLPNPIVLITKCAIPDDAVDILRSAWRTGLRPIVYLSYSGLGPAIERGIRHDGLKANFPRLADAGIPIVHYWRPAFPESATTATMEAVLDWAAAYAQCTIAAGLKVESAALPRLAQLWPELAQTPGVTTAECVYPERFWNFIHTTRDRHPNYPLFHTNSCALAFVLGQADRFGIFGSTVCTTRNQCPADQRRRCQIHAAARPAVTNDDVRAALDRRGHPDAQFSIDQHGGEVVIQDMLPTSSAAALTHDLGMRVRVDRQDTDPYWSSGTAGARPLVIGDAR